MENSTDERALSKFVIGRKNWMFFGSEKGGEAASVLMSFVQTCRNMDIDPQIYLEDIFKQLPDGKLVDLLPDRWHKTQSKNNSQLFSCSTCARMRAYRNSWVRPCWFEVK